MKYRLLVLLASATVSHSVLATSLDYEASNVGGNTWQYTYTVNNNSLPVAIENFTVNFDQTLYSNLTPVSNPAGWNITSIQPDPLLPNDGVYDALATNGGIAQGQKTTGFILRFNYLGANTPGAQGFQVFDVINFSQLDSGTTTKLANALPQLKGEIHADLLAASFNAHRLSRQAIFGRLDDVQLGRSSSKTQNTGSAGDVAQADKNVWVRGMGGFISTKADTQAVGFNETLSGVMLGSDFAFADNLQLGGAIGYVNNQVTASQMRGTGTTDSVQFIGYGLWHEESEFVKFAIGYGRDSYSSQRSVTLDTNNVSKRSDIAGNSGSIDVEAGTHLKLADYTVSPSFGVRGDIISRNSFTENGVLGIGVKGTTLTAAQTRLGAKVNRSFEFGSDIRVTPELRAYWLHDEGDSIASRSKTTLLGQSIGVNAANAGRDAASLGVGVIAEIGKDIALFADYNFEQRGAANGQNILGGLRMTW
jgi:outer membrane autotransporter protein